MVKRIIISGGGTGGHIFPAVAIANALQEADSSVEILFVGALGKMEMEKVPKAGYRIVGLPVVGIQRSLSLSNLLFPFKLINSLLKARDIVKEFKPDVAVGVGGFASGPLLMMASLSGVPTLIQEQNSYAGITNKLLAKRASTICVAYPDMAQFFPAEKIKLLGNPVRKDIAGIAADKAKALAHFGLEPGRKTLFAMGGSLGARSINESIYAGIDRIIEAGYQLIWQTGKGFIEKATELSKKPGYERVKVSEFIYEMDLAYSAADVVISRAGALSVSELCLVGKPAILVPFPFASEDHQTKNAMSLVAQNAAILVTDKAAATDLVKEALAVLSDTVRREILTENIIRLGKPAAAVEIAQEVLRLVTKDS